MLNLLALRINKNPGIAEYRGTTIPKKPCSPGSKFPRTIISCKSIRGLKSKLRRGRNQADQ